MNFNCQKKKNLPKKAENKKKTRKLVKGALSALPKINRGKIEIKEKKLELNQCSIEARNGEDGSLDNSKVMGKGKESEVQMNKETPERNSELKEGIIKVVRDRRLEAGRRFTFIAKNKKNFMNNSVQEGPHTPKAGGFSDAEKSVDLSQERKTQYDLFLKKQISIVHSKKRCQSQNRIFRSFQSLIQYLS